MDRITFSQAIEGYTLYAQARRLSTHTLADYMNTYRKLQIYLDRDPFIAEITTDQVRGFLASQTRVSDKTLLNYHTGLSALWKWADREGLVNGNLVRSIDPPHPEERAIVPLSQAEVEAILKSLDHSRAYTRPGKRECRHGLGAAVRNRAIILILLDTGIRADELCSLLVKDVNLPDQYLVVLGKGDKERQVPFGPRTGQAIWRYLRTRHEDRLNTPLILTRTGAPLRRDELCHLIVGIGQRAGVQAVHPHRLRHTFAINYLRNGGDVFTLQKILGHSTLDMVRHYLDIARADVQAAHRTASPVENWRL
jgi:integrase/recombinase XerD